MENVRAARSFPWNLREREVEKGQAQMQIDKYINRSVHPSGVANDVMPGQSAQPRNYNNSVFG